MPVVPALSQSTVPHAQADGLGAEPSVLAQTDGRHLLFWDRPSRSQYMPVVPAVSQSTLLPHAQADGLGTEPSVVAHAAGREQVLDAAVHTMPVPCPSPLLVQSTVPQAQADGLAEEPSVMAQVENCLHLFWDR